MTIEASGDEKEEGFLHGAVREVKSWWIIGTL
jgi:hypothetical protein